MIEIKNVTKSFDHIRAVDDVSVTIRENTVFGLIGTNGAGKSTVLRMVAGVLRQETGEIIIDGKPVFDNMEVKKKIYFIADEPYFFANCNAIDMQKYLSSVYPDFAAVDYYNYLMNFGLDKKRKVNTYSKGMKKQLALICGVCSNTKYLLCDETFDGLDPVMRQAVKALFVSEIEKRGLTPVIASHNLRELEDICETVGLLHKGGILFEKDLDEMKLNLHKIQCVIKEEGMLDRIRERLEILTMENRGALYTFTVRGRRQAVDEFMEQLSPIFYELLPLSLEEIFISETEVKGYDVKTLLF